MLLFHTKILFLLLFSLIFNSNPKLQSIFSKVNRYLPVGTEYQMYYQTLFQLNLRPLAN